MSFESFKHGNTLCNVLLDLVVGRGESGKPVQDLGNLILGDDHDAIDRVAESQVPGPGDSAVKLEIDLCGPGYAGSPDAHGGQAPRPDGQAGALELFDVPDPTGDEDALGAADLDPEGHDAAAHGVGLARGLLHEDDGAWLGEVGPVRIGRDGLWRGHHGSLQGRVLGSKEDCRQRGHHDRGRRCGRGLGWSGRVGDGEEIGYDTAGRHLELEEGIGYVAS